MKNEAVKLIVLDSKIDYDNVGESTGVDIPMRWQGMKWCCQQSKRLVVSGLRARSRTLGNTESTYVKDRQSLLQVKITIKQSRPMKRQCMGGSRGKILLLME